MAETKRKIEEPASEGGLYNYWSNGTREWKLKNGGAEGIRTLDLLDAIEARSQLRHGPTVKRIRF